MNKIRMKFIIFVGIFVVGLILLINSIDLGETEMSSIMQHNGGSMDTNNYLIYLEQSITKYRFLGTILSVLGGLGMLRELDEFMDTFSKS